MSLDAKQIVDAVATRGGIGPNAAEKAVGSILSILHHEAGPEIDPVLARVTGTAQLAQTYDVMSAQASGQSPGLIGTFIAALGGGLGEKTSP